MADLTRKTAKEKTIAEIQADPSALATASESGLVKAASAARFTLSADQTINGTSNQTIAWNTVDGSVGDVFSVSGGIVTVAVACTVEVDWKFQTSVDAGNITLRLFVNRSGAGATAEYVNVQDGADFGGFFSFAQHHILFNLSAGDTFYVTTNESNASTVDITASSSVSYMTVKRLDNLAKQIISIHRSRRRRNSYNLRGFYYILRD